MEYTLEYYRQPGAMTDPGPFAALFDNLRGSLPELVRVVQGVTIHVYWTDSYGFSLPAERQSEVQLRTLERRLARTLELDDRPLNTARAPERRLVGNCRDFSLLLTALLRRQGIPARARCGFGAYFKPGYFIDHWVAEYWNEAQDRWILVDAQMDEVQRGALNLPFDPLDTPRDQFITGGLAWQMCRRGQANPEHFGIFDLSGLGFVRGNLVRDVASLNKIELLPWDCWGIILKDQIDDPADRAMLDELAGLSVLDVPDIAEVRRRYETDERLTVANVLSFVQGSLVPVAL